MGRASKRVPVSIEVSAVLRAFFIGRLRVVASYSNPDGHCPLGNGRPTMKTIWGLDDSSSYFLEAETTWDRGERHRDRLNEKSEFWLYVPDGECDE